MVYIQIILIKIDRPLTEFRFYLFSLTLAFNSTSQTHHFIHIASFCLTAIHSLHVRVHVRTLTKSEDSLELQSRRHNHLSSVEIVF